MTSRGALRLVRLGYYSQAWNSGIVEIYYNGNWGNICDDTSFGITEADVICHQLSYTGASTYDNTVWSTRYIDYINKEITRQMQHINVT